MYHEVNGLISFLLDDDGGSHYTTLSMGYDIHQNFNLGVDYLYDKTGNNDVKKGLTLYFRTDHKISASKYGQSWRQFWWFAAGATWPNCGSSEVTDILRDPYGICKYR